MRCVFVGLGNPTAEYALHRHNAGMMVVDALHRHLQAPAWQAKHHSLISRSPDGLLLVKPQTYMNRSGLAVYDVLTFYKKTIEHIIVFHDDLDLPLGKIKIKIGGGHGGHNGLRDLDRLLGPDYLRVRLGIGRPVHKTQVHDYVLSPFTPDEKPAVEAMIQTVTNHLHDLQQLPLSPLQARLGENTHKLSTTPKHAPIPRNTGLF